MNGAAAPEHKCREHDNGHRARCTTTNISGMTTTGPGDCHMLSLREGRRVKNDSQFLFGQLGLK